ncbi:ATP-binding cassette sub-family G member 5 isoform X4 [Parasteatoda tepidariorum]|uniref:ATP-binding cassette sub-family G member 5 isoform X2 n=1 Tax=Parasteatoda tepidariorum TaxID=114398 RepID=UPI001C727EA4|nr:ATP-binding cassette sub-family G member 5 isoform X1 [Parasteatoda tepidariorum]XP_042910580.1 ATP-binding cassette sub-family G member 5 isoform X2 [Parasteatoda tepidariorum]XP_042910619.1 ATP-binding cassette sub-family G member 5 isoform X3 [Parasteatoda tepidariorum]XP_042910660.1 ATP-binding cassette sub-family G member 5 isoform X2 [Parasteatoda tepidariorum]XP_042910715.1 ATP-binding cassette sub-family G member 5 isoform X3 [Parasteatoda tepidariorum]
MKELKPLPDHLGPTTITADHVLELNSVFHTGQVEPGSCFQKLSGSVPTGTVLKDVSMEVHAGEVMAVLGSKGSGKRALLEVIGRRAMGLTRGQIMLNEISLNLQLFQEQCGFVPKQVTLLPGMTVRQTLMYAAQLTIGTKVSKSMKRSRVKQVMADLALNQVSNREVSCLKPSEYRRLAIGIELVKDPVMILLDDPTYDLDPLNTYFVISILSNHAKKYNRIVILSMEKPRSDIFPFLDRVTYLSLGEVVYTGSTRMLLDYFGSIGFPCPELENPLMYYLCLSTVDRRTRERFIESSTQISALVEKFKMEGGHYRKFYAPQNDALESKDARYKLPLTAYGQPSSWQVFCNLVCRRFRILFNCNSRALREVFLRILLIPLFFTLLLLFYFQISDFQHSFLTRNGLILNSLVGVSFLSAAITAITHAPHRNRYYQESREGIYKGPLFVLSSIFYSLPLSIITVTAGATIIYAGGNLREEWERWITFCAVLWTVYIFAEQQTVSLMIIIKSSYTSFITSIYILIIYITFASGTVRSLTALPEWFYYLTYGVLYRYAGAFLQENEFSFNPRLDRANYLNGTEALPCNSNIPGSCIYIDGNHYLLQKYPASGRIEDSDLQYWMNFGLCFVFVGGMWVLNTILHLVPLPAFIKTKFRN